MFALCQHHKWQISEVENLLPFERDIYTKMLEDWMGTNKAPSMPELYDPLGVYANDPK